MFFLAGRVTDSILDRLVIFDAFSIEYLQRSGAEYVDQFQNVSFELGIIYYRIDCFKIRFCEFRLFDVILILYSISLI
jgi:hypothetical protein